MDRIDLPVMNRAPAPQMVPDQRPTADAAAIARDPRPQIPVPIVASPVTARGLSQVAEVTKSALRAEAPSATDPSLPLDKRLTEVQRTLKPYGVSMLPDSRKAQEAKAAEARADKAEDAARGARAEATQARDSADASAEDAPVEADEAVEGTGQPTAATGQFSLTTSPDATTVPIVDAAA